MRIVRPKFFIVLAYEAIVFTAAFLLVKGVCANLFGADAAVSPRTILVLGLFFSSYFFLMWRDLYSRNYHYYLKNTYRIVLRNTCLSLLLIVAILAVLSGIERSQLLPALFFYLPVGALSFFLVHGSHFLWIRYLSHIGYFRQELPDHRHTERGLRRRRSSFQDIGNTKNYVGRLYRERRQWEWHGHPARERRRIRSLRDVKSLILKENVGEIIFILGDSLQAGGAAGAGGLLPGPGDRLLPGAGSLRVARSGPAGTGSSPRSRCWSASQGKGTP